MHGRFSIIGGTCPGCPLSLRLWWLLLGVNKWRLYLTTSISLDVNLIVRLNSLTGDDQRFAHNHSARLISPVFTLNQTSCLSSNFTAISRFSVRLGYLQNNTYKETLLHRNILTVQPIGLYQTLQRTLPFVASDRQEFVLIFEAVGEEPGIMVYLSEVQLLDGKCYGKNIEVTVRTLKL